MEKMFDRVMRHVKNGQVDLASIGRGIVILGEYIRSHDILNSSIEPESRSMDLMGVEGLNRYIYAFKTTESLIRRQGQFEVIEFPFDSHFEVEVTGSGDGELIGTERHLQKSQNAIAEFVGPTISFDWEDDSTLPNNGFFYRKNPKMKRDFQDTYPSGMRRGAVGIKKSGETIILTDAQKWKIVRSKFVGFDIIFGTSTYFTSEDKLEECELFSDSARDKVSFLVEYIGAKKTKHLCFVHINAQVPRLVAKCSIDFHMKEIGARSYIAAEMELLGSGCYGKSLAGYTELLTRGNESAYRNDHYMVVPNHPVSLIPPDFRVRK